MFQPLFSPIKISVYFQINITVFELKDYMMCSDILQGKTSISFFKIFFIILVHIFNQNLSQLIS